MAINTNLLIAAPMLQDLLVDPSTGLPLSDGVITLYQDNSRTTLKNWYYQTGTAGNYTYTTLPNPLTLSGGGTIVDINGVDTIPFYYPYSETDNVTVQPYYIVITNSGGQQIKTVQNFPFLPSQSPSGNSVPTNKNLIVNSSFWRNFGTSNISATDTVVALSQHGGFSSPDMHFIKNTTDATETITFNQFTTDNTLPNDVTPQYYMNLNCTVAGTETSKVLQIPLALHIKNLSGYVGACVAIDAMAVSGSVHNQITLSLYQFTGTGAASSSVTKVIQTLTLTNTFQKYVIAFSFPTSQGLSLGAGGDDAWYLQIGFPAAQTCNINIAKPSIYLSTTAPTNDFDTYDAIDSIINSTRTGDIKITMNTFTNNATGFGWVPANDGTIGSPSSSATTRANADTWPLYNVLWNSVSNTYAPVTGGRGVSAYADFSANKAIGLTKQLGRVIAGIGTPSSGDNTGTVWALGQTTGNEQYTLQASDLPQHTHNAPVGTNFVVTTGTGENLASSTNGTTSNVTGGVTGFSSQTIVNLQDPVIYYQIYMKL